MTFVFHLYLYICSPIFLPTDHSVRVQASVIPSEKLFVGLNNLLVANQVPHWRSFLDFVQCINVNILLRHYFKYLGIEATVIYGSLLNRSKVLTMKTIFIAEICETVFALLSACPMSSLKWLAESQTTPTSGLMRRRTTKIMGNGFTTSSPNWAVQLTAKFHLTKQVTLNYVELTLFNFDWF